MSKLSSKIKYESFIDWLKWFNKKYNRSYKEKYE